MKILGWVIIGLWVIYEAIGLRPLTWPLLVYTNPLGGTGYIIGQLAVLALGIWLVKRKKKPVNKDKE